MLALPTCIHPFQEHERAMKKVLALLIVAVCALPAAPAAQTDAQRLVAVFSNTVRTEGATLQVTLLNDKTVEALFASSPAKAAFKTKARMTTVFYVQGTVNKEFEFRPSVVVVQGNETLPGKASSIKNFVAGKIARGEQIAGLVELSKSIDLYRPFRVTISGSTAEIRYNEDDVRDHGNR
jgi:hypothetical protein